MQGTELKGKKIGIIGLGAIGKRVYEIAKCFMMEPYYYDIKHVEGYEFAELYELLGISDFISINCPLTSETRHLINAETLSKMKSAAFLINTARGEIVDIEALYNALLEGKLKGAALDVIECEENLCELFSTCQKNSHLMDLCSKKYLFIKKLFELPNVIITPHIAYNTAEANLRINKITLENINSSFNVNSDTKNLILI